MAHDTSSGTASRLAPLAGLRVLEISAGVPLAFTGKLLSDLGATVLKIEPQGGDPLRQQGPFLSGAGGATSALFGYLNAGKRSIEIDHASATAASAIAGHLADCDLVLVDADDFGRSLLTERLAPEQPDRPTTIVLSPYGLNGERSLKAGSAFTAQHSGGFAYHQAYPVTDPEKIPPTGVADRESEMITGLVAVNAALWAVLSAHGNQVKPFVDLSIEDVFAFLLVDALADEKEGRLAPNRQRLPGQGITIAGGLVWFLPCADGAIMVSPREDHQWARWVEMMGNPAWASDAELCGSRAARTANSGRLQELMAEWSAHVNAYETFKAAQAARIACFPVSTANDLLQNEQLHARGFFDRLTVDGRPGLSMPGLPFQMRSSGGASLPRERQLAFPERSDVVSGSQHRPQKEPMSEPRFFALPPSSNASEQDCLSGVRVVDFSWVVAGPMATKTLGAMGAEVIKIESSTRPEFAFRKAWFSVINNNKLSSTFNITSPEGQALIHNLVAQSDVVVENFSSRVLSKNNLSYDDLRRVKPDIIFVSASGLGRTGPEQDMLAYGSLLQGYSGRVSLIGTMNAGLEGMGVMPAWTDPVTSLWESFAILSALRHRALTGEGCYIDLSMLEATVALLPDAVLHSATGGRTTERGSESEIGAAPSGCFRCLGDDAWVAISVRDDREWQGLRQALGLADDPALADRAARLERKAELNAMLAKWCAGMTAEAAEAALQAQHVPAAVSRGIREMLKDRHLAERNIFQEVGDGSWSIALPWVDATGWRGTLAATPQLGADNDYVFGQLLGLPKSEQARLKTAGVIA